MAETRRAEAPEVCPACGVPPVPVPKPIKGYRLVRCPDCSLRWWDFSSVDTRALYGPEYFRGASGDGYDDYYAMQRAMGRTFQRRLRRIGRILGLRTGRVLDCGCGPGFFLDVARQAGWDVAGIEISDAAATYARDTLHLPVTTTTLEEASLPQASYDLVTMWDVIEHLPDPRAALAKASAALKQGGALVLTTGDVASAAARLSGARWHLYNLPEHFFFHTRPSLQALASKTGLRVVTIRCEPMIVSLSYAIERISRSYLGGAGRRLARFVPDVLFPVSLHDVMTLYALRD